jgi:hypothetical protein
MMAQVMADFRAIVLSYTLTSETRRVARPRGSCHEC